MISNNANEASARAPRRDASAKRGQHSRPRDGAQRLTGMTPPVNVFWMAGRNSWLSSIVPALISWERTMMPSVG